jgi:hypothetical protein
VAPDSRRRGVAVAATGRKDLLVLICSNAAVE